MEPGASRDITQLLVAWNEGDQEALDRLMPLVFQELHRLAHHYMAGERRGHPLQTTALVNEAYLRLVDSSRVRWRNRVHFFAVSAQLMRRVLVDVARSRKSSSAAAMPLRSPWMTPPASPAHQVLM